MSAKVYERCACEMESLISDAADMALDEMTVAALGTARDVLRERVAIAALIEKANAVAALKWIGMSPEHFDAIYDMRAALAQVQEEAK
jgi:hypothetical protein